MHDETTRSQSTQDALDADLQSAIAELLDLDSAEIRTNSSSTFIQLGGNSVKALELTFKLDAVGKSLDVETLLKEENSILSLSQALQQTSDNTSEDQVTSSEVSSSDVQTPDSDSSHHHASTSFHRESTLVEEASQRLNCSQDDIEHVLSLTSQQRGLWLGSLQVPGAYVSRWRYQLADDIDLNRLENAWRRVLRITPVLRTRILSSSDSKFYQVVLTNDHYEGRNDLLHQQDITADEGALLFGYNIEANAECRNLNLVCHHALYDRWSMRLILQDVQSAYQSDRIPGSRPSYLPFLELLHEVEVGELHRQWRAITQDEAIVSSPTVHQSQGFALASKVCEVAASSSTAKNTTHAELITAAWSLVCSKHCGSNRVSFGLTVWGRDAPLSGVMKMAFPTFNTVPFVSDISEIDTVNSFLRSIKSRLRLTRQSQLLDIETISAISSTCREVCRFNSILVIQQDPSIKEQNSLFDNKNLLDFDTTQSAPLVLECTPRGDEIVFKMKYDPAYVFPVEAEAMLHHLKTAFERLSSANDESLNSLSLFNQHDLQYVNNWVIPSLSLERTTLHALVEEAARVRPDSVAIWQTDISMTYSALIDAARKVTAKLMVTERHEHPNIGVCFEKSAYAVVAMLGISMSGYTFVPMDASNPFNRLMQLVESADMDLVLCSSTMASKFRQENVQTMVVNDETLTETSNEYPSVSSDPGSNVYIIYTSGSTGQPKGVEMTHQALCTTLIAISNHLEFSEDTRSLQFSSFAFDMSVHDIWCTFLKGGVVCMPTDAERFELEDFLSRSKCNYAMLTPSVALTLSEESWQSFEKLSTSGEPLPKAVFRSALHAGVKFWNTYGPTESCVICLTEQINEMDASALKLGYSMAATSWIIDADDPHRLAPIGCVGELALTGHTLAAGYYRDPEKTEQAFMPNLDWTKQFPNHPLEKVYRTGDLARYQSDGSIEFIGRLGGYIKIAGNRVDLGEIEYVLHSKCNLPKVSVQYCKVGNTETRDLLVSFCAYPSNRKSEAPELLPMTKEIREKVTEAFRKLKELLPSYMIPAVFVPVNRFPHNTAGKLDKRSLIGLIADQNIDDLLNDHGIEAETNTSEKLSSEDQNLSSEASALRTSWAAVLKMTTSKISGRSNFFRLGGDSLRAMNLVANLRQSGQSISSSDVFKYPMLNDMADRMKSTTPKSTDVAPKDIWSPKESERVSSAAADALHLSKQQIESVLPCTSLQTQMLAASAQSTSTYLHRECFELTPDVTMTEIMKVHQSLIDNNELLRSKAFVDQDTGQFVLVVLKPESLVSLPRKGGSLHDYLKSDTEPMGIERDLARFIILENGGNPILIWEMHHSIFDGYSNILLVRQMKEAIDTCRQSKIDKLSGPQIPPRFSSFVSYINNADKDQARSFWSEYLQNAPEPSSLSVQSNSLTRATNAKITRQLDFKAPPSAFTLAIYLRTAFALTLSQYATSDDIVFAATNHGRDLAVKDIERLAGPTFSTLPVRCIIDKDESIGTLLSKLQVEAAEITSYQYLSTEEIGSINTGCKQACQFATHLLIQSVASDALFEDLEGFGYRNVPDISPMSLQIPFNLVATAKGTSFQFDVIYNDVFFPNHQISLFLDQFASNLTTILAADDNMAVREICQLSETNQDAYLAIQPKQGDQGNHADLTIPELVFHDLSDRAKNQAIYSTKSSLTYEDLYELASALSENITTHVRSHNHSYIAISFEKSPSAIIAQLAVLMTGHAYVSLDASWPVSRKRDVLKQIECPLLIASTETVDRLQDLDTKIMTFDIDNAERLTLQHDKQPSFKARPEEAAYVIFTSGSTGTPKGVVVQHKAICRTLHTYAERLDFSRETRSLLFASFSFDASVMETWSVLAAGGTLCVANDDERISDMDDFLDRSRVDCVGLTPTSAMLIDASRHDHIKTLLFCGEKCQTKDLERWTSKPDLTLVNAYGPSETSVNAVMNMEFSCTDLSNIGSSMGGGLWIVNPNDHDQLVPVGGVGELLVTGPVLAKEYLKDPERTAQKFVYPRWPSWTGISDQRAYKTGDLVRLDFSGELHFVGRHDGQMKVNGIRIEAEEIESAVSQQSHLAISETLVGLYSSVDQVKHNELTMFFVSSGESSNWASASSILPLWQDHQRTIAQLYKHLTSVLPRTHVPSLYVPVSAIPRSATGKTDRKTLSQALALLCTAQVDLYRPTMHDELPCSRHGADSNINTTRVSPGTTTSSPDLTTTETTLISLWTQILHLSTSSKISITPESHFIRSGGDSVSAIRLSSLARSRKIDLPVGLIYSNPKLADMAAAVDGNRKADDGVGGGEMEKDGFADLLSPEPFELLDGVEFSPVLSRPGFERGGREGSDYFGRKNGGR